LVVSVVSYTAVKRGEGRKRERETETVGLVGYERRETLSRKDPAKNCSAQIRNLNELRGRTENYMKKEPMVERQKVDRIMRVQRDGCQGKDPGWSMEVKGDCRRRRVRCVGPEAVWTELDTARTEMKIVVRFCCRALMYEERRNVRLFCAISTESFPASDSGLGLVGTRSSLCTRRTFGTSAILVLIEFTSAGPFAYETSRAAALGADEESAGRDVCERRASVTAVAAIQGVDLCVAAWLDGRAVVVSGGGGRWSLLGGGGEAETLVQWKSGERTGFAYVCPTP
jgi:hypothetical protein